LIKDPANTPPLFYVAYHVFGVPELKFRIKKLEMDMNELDTRLRHVLGHQRYEYCHQCAKCSSGCPAASFLDFRPRRGLAMGIEAEKLAINLNLSPVGEILKKLEGK
jgi:ferredoxin